MIQLIGGSGFVGTRLISLLGQKNCNNLDKNNSQKYPKITKIGDIRNIDSLIFDNNIKCVVLLAAEHKDDVEPKSLYYDVNVEGTQNVLNKMDEKGIKNLIFTSTVAIYGLDKKNPNENFPSDPFNHYGKSKWNAEKIIKKWYDQDPDDKTVVIVRPTVIFGENNRGNVYNLFKQIMTKKFLMIGDGHNKKSLSYVGNVVSFIKNRIEKSDEGYYVYNYSDKPDFSMIELINKIKYLTNIKILNIKIPYLIGIIGGYFFDIVAKISGKKLPISSIRIKKFCATTQFDSKKMLEIFKPPYTIDKGLEKTLNNEFLNNKNR
tara:strand:- start:827 stop:1783 length:957 start_codon:yes stop_codon:yes gene_type:complete